MRDGGGHNQCVEGWLARSARDASPDVLVRLFAAALAALWNRTKTTLGEVTLTAIAERVLLNASEQYPAFRSLAVTPAGVELGELHPQHTSTPAEELQEGIQFVLAELLIVVGNLTAEILTPALHAVLVGVATPAALVAVPAEAQGS